MLNGIIIGTGGWGSEWCARILPKAIHKGLFRLIGAVDPSEKALSYAKETLHLKEAQCFTDAQTAFEVLKPDICFIAAPPDVHETLGLLAMKHGCHILCEKPITNDAFGVIRLLEESKKTKTKMGITMSHRYSRPIWSLRKEIASGKYGRLNYIVFNFSARGGDYSNRQLALENVMLNELGIHHLDFLEAMVGVPCTQIYTDQWCPPHAQEMTGGGQSLTIMTFENGVRVGYEISYCNASTQNSWGKELIRVELEQATLILHGTELRCFWKSEPEEVNRPGMGEEVALSGTDDDAWSHDYLLEQFVSWVKGGEPMETAIQHSIRSQMLVFAAVESSKTNQLIHINTFIAKQEDK